MLIIKCIICMIAMAILTIGLIRWCSTWSQFTSLEKVQTIIHILVIIVGFYLYVDSIFHTK